MLSSYHNHNLFLFTFLSTLLSISTLSTATTRDEAQQVIQSGITYLFLTYDEIHVREIQTLSDPVLHEKYKKCGVIYTNAVNTYIECQNYLKSGNIQKLPSLAATALQGIQTCDNIFTPPGSETRFKGLSEGAIDACNRVLAAVKGLP